MDDMGIDDYYAILGVPHEASESDIKKAYRKEALKWHPDKNPHDKEKAKKQFQKVSEAYQVLSEKPKRDAYDRRRTEVKMQQQQQHRGMEQRGHRQHQQRRQHPAAAYEYDGMFPFNGFHFRDPEEVFRDFFEGRDPFGDELLFPSPFNNILGFREPRKNTYMNAPPMFMFSPFGPSTGFDNFFGTGYYAGIRNRRDDVLALDSRPRTTTKTTTIIKNGKKITRKVVVENGKETITEFTEDYAPPGHLTHLRA